MRYLRSIVKYFLFFLLGAMVATLVTLTTVSYYAVEHLTLAKPIFTQKVPDKRETAAPIPTETPWINANILDILRVGDQYAAELNQFDELRREIPAQKSPSLCEILCAPSVFDKERMLEERTAYLKKFFHQNGSRALQDPSFQLKLREVGFLSELFPPSFRQIWIEVEEHREHQPTFIQKLSWSLRFELAALAELAGFPRKWQELHQESVRIQGFRDLIQSCHKGLRSAKDLRADCLRL